jgi:hypothetical protein
MEITFSMHLDDEVLDGYVLGTLPSLRVAEVEEHILICEECQDRLDGTSVFVQSISAAALKFRQDDIPPTYRSTPR